MDLPPPMTVCDDVVLCSVQEGPGTEGFCGVSISTVVDGGTVEGRARHAATEGCFCKRGSQFDLHVINKEEAL